MIKIYLNIEQIILSSDHYQSRIYTKNQFQFLNAQHEEKPAVKRHLLHSFCSHLVVLS